MKRLLITGLTGKSGTIFARELATRGLNQQYELRGAVRPTSSLAAIKACLPKLECVSGVLEDEAYLDRITKDVDIVFHIAGIHWSLPLVKAAVANGVKRIIVVHTTGVYSKYKAAGEEYRNIDAAIQKITAEAGCALTILRPTMIYGSINDRNMIKFVRMVDQLHPMPVVNGGKYLLQPVHAEDLGVAYAQVMENLAVTEQKDYILSGRDSAFLIDVFRMIAEELGCSRKFVSVPFWLAYGGAWGVYLLSLGKVDFREKVQRLCEDRSFPHESATKDFHYSPMPLREGLHQEVQLYLRQKAEN